MVPVDLLRDSSWVPYGGLLESVRRKHGGHRTTRGNRGVLRAGVRPRSLDGASVSLADVVELVLAAGLMVYLVYALIRPERF